MRQLRQMAPRRWIVTLAGLLGALVTLAACGGGAGAPASNMATATATVKPSMVYVALGASDAVGVAATDPNRTAYIPLLISRLPAHAEALNLGVSGYTVHQALSDELPPALAAHPSLVTVWLVGNDFRQCTPLDQYQRDLDALLGQLQSQTQARVFVANAPDMSLLPAIRDGSAACLRGQRPAQIRALAEQWNTAIAAVVAKHHDALVDLFHSDLAAHPEYISTDGFHPSDAGYRILADIFWRQITAQHAIPSV